MFSRLITVKKFDFAHMQTAHTKLSRQACAVQAIHAITRMNMCAG